MIRATQNGKPSDILEVVKLHGEDFTEVNVATTFHELSKLAAGFSEADKKELQQDPTFQNLIGKHAYQSLQKWRQNSEGVLGRECSRTF